ncbi:MAG: hypothetical protein HFH29_16070 [Eubacterium sp.]|nr:hypothetical protein [Eubacterium sp.]
MCISKADLDQRIKKIRNLKMLKAKVDEALEQFEAEVIDFLQENPECHVTDKKGKPVLQYVGANYRATYAEQSRETVDRAGVKKLLCEDDFQKVSRVTFYHTLRIR